MVRQKTSTPKDVSARLENGDQSELYERTSWSDRVPKGDMYAGTQAKGLWTWSPWHCQQRTGAKPMGLPIGGKTSLKLWYGALTASGCASDRDAKSGVLAAGSAVRLISRALKGLLAAT